MCDELVDFLETAHCGDALPTLRAADLSHGLKIVAIIRTGDQVRIRCRRRCSPATPPRILAARALPPESQKL